MDRDAIIREWFFRLPKGYANAPYSKKEMDVLHEVLEENGLNGSIFVKEIDQLDQAFHDAEPVDDSEKKHTINLREALVKIGDKTYQLNKAEVDKITDYLEKDMKKTDFSPMGRQVKTASGKSLVPKAKRQIGKFAEEEHWQSWLDTVEGIIPDKKLQKLYFTLYDITSATYTAKYIDEVLDELYSANPKVLATDLFSMKKAPIGESGYSVPEDFQGLADIGTVRGGSKGTEMGRGEFLIPMLFDRGELGGANATHDVDINGKGWHVKELKNRNGFIRLGMTTFANSKLANVMSSKVGLDTKEFNFSKVQPALTEPIKSGKMSVIDALNEEYGGVENEYDALMKIQEELDKEMRELAIATGDGQGLIFYVPGIQTMYFVPTEECICGGATQGAHTVGMSYSGRPEGRFAIEAKKIG